MLRFDLLSAVPGLLESPLRHSIIKNAQEKQRAEVAVHDLRDFSRHKHRKVDDYPYGGGAGMVLMPQPVFDGVEHLKQQREYDEVIFMTPDAPLFKQEDANRLSLCSNLMILCGHYKGMDQRVRDHLVTREYSIGDVVLSGGELPALMLVDAVVRLLPGVLGDAESALTDSFMNDFLLGPPVYTRPAEFQQLPIPAVLRSGNHQKVEEWRQQQSQEKTKQLRPDLYKLYLQNQ
ncbi:MAG: tRNA (guanosine(37)-N1)-methyltransferase TrmD [Cyclonatronaceae bacterium]